MTRKSRIFSNSELKELKRREKGDYSDRYGFFSSKIKPKIQELLEIWFPKKKEFEGMIKDRRKKLNK